MAGYDVANIIRGIIHHDNGIGPPIRSAAVKMLNELSQKKHFDVLVCIDLSKRKKNLSLGINCNQNRNSRLNCLYVCAIRLALDLPFVSTVIL
jgi:hypothetical protein